MNFEKEANEGIESLIDAGSAIIGSAAGAVSGWLLGGPEGAALGSATGLLIKKVLIEIGNDASERLLSEREKMRMGGVMLYSADKIRKKLAMGCMPRDDAFWGKRNTMHSACAELPFVERPAAEEILEGILLAAQREYEEKKLPFLGNLYANIAFDSSIDRPNANFLLKIAENISFRQICILSLFSHTNRLYLEARHFESSAFPYADMKLNSIFQEIFDLGSQGLLYRDGEPVAKASDFNIPLQVRTVGAGADLCRLMELNGIDKEYLDDIINILFPQKLAKLDKYMQL
jgi:hypothetical protein